MNELSQILILASKKRWCTSLYCTTCGSMDFRGVISKYSREQLIQYLKEITQVEIDRHRDAVILCFYEASILRNGRDLYDDLQHTPSGDLLEKIFKHEESRRRAYESEILKSDYRKTEKLERVKVKASYDIIGAIRRKDFLAIEALIAKGADLTQKDENELTIESKINTLKEIYRK